MMVNEFSVINIILIIRPDSSQKELAKEHVIAIAQYSTVNIKYNSRY